MSTNQPYQPQFQPPKKKHTVRNVVIGVTVVMFLVIGGCTALIGGEASKVTEPSPSVVQTEAPVTVETTEPTPAPPATEAPKPTPAPKPTATKPAMTLSQEQAVAAAESYLELTAFSRKGLLRQLSSDAGEGFSVKDATFAVDHVKVNWNEQAARSARSYLELTHFSRAGLIRQLESDSGEGFTHRQAVYGVTKAGL
jgi:hypothetical protein